MIELQLYLIIFLSGFIAGTLLGFIEGKLLGFIIGKLWSTRDKMGK